MTFDLSASIQQLLNTVVSWSPRIVGGILVLIIGFAIVNFITKIIGKSMDRSGIDNELKPFLKSLASVILKVLVVLTAANVVGIEITAFAALLAGAGLAIGAALSGTLQHFAAGVMVLIFKPYKIGDLVDVQGVVGHVEEIQIFNTVIKTLDNKKVIIPNATATKDTITNLSANGKLRVDLNVAMPYEEDFNKIQTIIRGALAKTPKILKDEPTIEIEKFGEHNVLLAVRPYATPEDYWDVYFTAYSNIKKAFGEAGITVAYPSTRVTMMNK